jgi:hypothetical protein
MAARKMLVGCAVLTLGVGMTVSVATALSPCGYQACSDEVAASGLSGQARGACIRQVMADCRAGLCSCTGGSPPCSCVCGDGDHSAQKLRAEEDADEKSTSWSSAVAAPSSWREGR